MTHTPRPFQWRAFTSVVVAAAFVLLVVSGVILFLSPPGRIANWTNWAILGLRKTEWTGLHVWFGMLFLLAAVLHLVFNWRPMVGYFKDRLTRRIGLRWEWVAALVIVGAVFAGTRLAIPPFSSLLAWNEDFKQGWDTPAARAPIPHAELLTLSELAAQGGVPVETATARLTARGITGFTSDAVVQTIAQKAGLSAQQVYDIILADRSRGGGRGPGGGPSASGGGGPGRKTLAQFCLDEGLSLDSVVQRLSASGIRAQGELTLREIAMDAGYSRPFELLEFIRSSGVKP